MKALTKQSFHRMLQILMLGLLGGLLVIAIPSCGRKSEEQAGGQPHAHPEAATYTCPMHPEVTQASPGECPSCGMKLTLASSEHEHSTELGSNDRAHADHDAKHGGMLGMQGDRHVELVARHGGELEVHLYDEYTKPLAAPGAGARVDLELPDDSAQLVSVQLEPQSAPGTWRGHSKLADRAVAATVTLQLPEMNLTMTFPLQSTFTGEVIDLACYARLGEAGRGAIHAACARSCIENGLPVGLLVADTIYLLTLDGDDPDRAANGRLAELAGRQVQVTGRVTEAGGVKILELADVREIGSGG